jgi:hypothetical protein
MTGANASGSSLAPQPILHQVTEEIADVERGIAGARQVEIDGVETVGLQDQLIVVEVAVDERRRRLLDGRGDPLTSREDVFQSPRSVWFPPRKRAEPVFQDPQFVLHAMFSIGLEAGAVNLPAGFGDPPGDVEPRRAGEHRQGRPTGDAPLEPHPQLRQLPDGFRHADAIRGIRREAVVPEPCLHPVAPLVEALRPDLAQQGHRLSEAATPLDPEIELQEAPSPGFVTKDSDAPHVQLDRLTEERVHDRSEPVRDVDGVEGRREEGQMGVREHPTHRVIRRAVNGPEPGHATAAGKSVAARQISAARRRTRSIWSGQSEARLRKGSTARRSNPAATCRRTRSCRPLVTRP